MLNKYYVIIFLSIFSCALINCAEHYEFERLIKKIENAQEITDTDTKLIPTADDQKKLISTADAVKNNPPFPITSYIAQSGAAVSFIAMGIYGLSTSLAHGQEKKEYTIQQQITPFASIAACYAGVKLLSDVVTRGPSRRTKKIADKNLENVRTLLISQKI